MGVLRKKKCRNCKELFRPDPRNANRQKYCSKPECRKAGKAESQRKWLEKPENKDYFRSPEHVERVRKWRQNHPGYWRREPCSQNALQDPLQGKLPDNKDNNGELEKGGLQDILTTQSPVLIGLISNFTGTALQDDIARTLRNMEELGRDIIDRQIREKGELHGIKTSHQSAAYP